MDIQSEYLRYYETMRRKKKRRQLGDSWEEYLVPGAGAGGVGGGGGPREYRSLDRPWRSEEDDGAWADKVRLVAV